MKEIPLTQGKVALVDDEDYDFLKQWKWNIGNGVNTFYAKRNEPYGSSQRTVRMHRVIMGVTDKNIYCDHIDGNGLNNQRSNLRVCTSKENTRNRVSERGSASKHKGVSFNTRLQKWLAQIRVDGKLIHIGCFVKESDAAIAYNELAVKHHGEFARLNVV